MSYRRVSPDDLADAIQQELSGYLASLQIQMNAAALKAMKRLVQLTKSTAPRGKRGSFAKSIKMEQPGLWARTGAAKALFLVRASAGPPACTFACARPRYERRGTDPGRTHF